MELGAHVSLFDGLVTLARAKCRHPRFLPIEFARIVSQERIIRIMVAHVNRHEVFVNLGLQKVRLPHQQIIEFALVAAVVHSLPERSRAHLGVVYALQVRSKLVHRQSRQIVTARHVLWVFHINRIPIV